MIAAVGRRGELGLRGDLIWRIPADLKHFKRVTMGRHLLMGRKTYESIGRPLPGRTTLILTRGSGFSFEGCVTLHSVQEALEYARRAGERELMVCGGAEVYQALLPWAQTLYLSQIEASAEADAYFPALEEGAWQLTSSIRHPSVGGSPAWVEQVFARVGHDRAS